MKGKPTPTKAIVWTPGDSHTAHLLGIPNGGAYHIQVDGKPTGDWSTRITEAKLMADRLPGRYVDNTTTVVLIACGSRKLSHAAAAQDLYIGSLFKAARAAAEAIGAEWGILSALHGLVLPSERLEPYNKRLSNNGEAISWAARVNNQLRGVWPESRFICLAPARYALALEGLRAEYPLHGLGIGLQLGRLKLIAMGARVYNENDKGESGDYADVLFDHTAKNRMEMMAAELKAWDGQDPEHEPADPNKLAAWCRSYLRVQELKKGARL